MSKLKIKSKEISNAKRELQKLIENILKTHERSKPTTEGKKTLTKRSGNLFNQIKPSFSLSGDKVVMEVQMMEYYKYLDEGTKHIEPWFFSEEIMDSSKLEDITEKLVIGSIEETLTDMISNIQKKK
jgi:hypothetical protein